MGTTSAPPAPAFQLSTNVSQHPMFPDAVVQVKTFVVHEPSHAQLPLAHAWSAPITNTRAGKSVFREPS